MFVVEGATSVYCNKDVYLPLCFVLASLDMALAHTLSPLGICFIFTSSNLDFNI